MALPPVTPSIVSPPLGTIREDGVGSDEQAIALDAYIVGKVSDGRSGGQTVWMVELDERVEAVFRVDIVGTALEDLVGRRGLMGMYGSGPRQVRLLGMGRG